MLETAPSLLSVREAQTHILERVEPLPPERVPLAAARGRPLAEPIVARVDVPPWDNSAMDGYAVRAGEAGPGTSLPVAFDLPAGSTAGRELPEGAAARIMTGAPLPAGADAVVPVEATSGPEGPGAFAAPGEAVRFEEPVAAGDHVRSRGEDVRAGATAVPAGTVCGPAEIAMAATVGRAVVTVRRRARVALVSTGDELVDVEEAGTPDRIVASNAYGLAAAVDEAGGEPVTLPVVPDDPDATRAAVRAALGCDAVVTIGGVSVGERDHVRAALEAEGVALEFRRVALKPGGPTAFGRSADGRPVFALPGNPVSALVTFEAFARPALLRMAGHERCFRPRVRARLIAPAHGRPGKAHWIRARLRSADDGWTAEPTGPQGSGILSSLVAGDALILLPPDVERVDAGETVEVLALVGLAAEGP